jgi:hypothetical protein
MDALRPPPLGQSASQNVGISGCPGHTCHKTDIVRQFRVVNPHLVFAIIFHHAIRKHFPCITISLITEFLDTVVSPLAERHLGPYPKWFSELADYAREPFAARLRFSEMIEAMFAPTSRIR